MRYTNPTFFNSGSMTVTAAGTAEELSSGPVKDGVQISVHANPTNTGYIYVAKSQTNAQTAGSRKTLSAGEVIELQVDALDNIWVNSSVSGEGVEWCEGEFRPAIAADLDVTVNASDIQIGAIEIKDGESDTRAVVASGADDLANGNQLVTASVLYALDDDGTYDRLNIDTNGSLEVNVTNRVDSVITDGNQFVQIPTDGGTAKTTGIHALGTDGTLAQILKTDSSGELQVDVLTTSIDGFVYADDADWSDGTSKHALVGGLYQSTPQTITDGDVGPIQVDSKGNIIESNSSAIKTALEIIDDWDDSNYCNVNLNVAGTDVSGGSGILTAQTIRVALATDDPQLGQVGAAADADGNLHGQLFYNNNILDAIDTNTDIPTTITSGNKTVTTAGTAEALGTTLAIKSVFIRAKSGNTGNIYVGDSTVDKDTNQGVILAANDSVTLNIANRATVFIDSSVNTEGVDYVCMS
jgi:hypothetical protein